MTHRRFSAGGALYQAELRIPFLREFKQLEKPSWEQLLDAAHQALENAQNEIALARTRNQLEFTELRRRACQAHLDKVTSALCKWALDDAREGWLIGYGQPSPKETERVIAPSLFSFGDFDWETLTLTGDGWLYPNVKFIDVPSAPEEVRTAMHADLVKAGVNPLPVWCQGLGGSGEASAGAARAGRHSKARLESWYKRWVEDHSKNGMRHSVKDDWKAAKAALGAGVTSVLSQRYGDKVWRLFRGLSVRLRSR